MKIQEVKAKEREDALFECVLSHPLSRIAWTGKNATLEDGEKYTITVSEDRLIHRLLVKDCMQLDKGIYTAIAGIKTCSAWLMVEGEFLYVQYNHMCHFCINLFRKMKYLKLSKRIRLPDSV